ncbi:MAG TPA: hypothetical protein VKM54_10325 [Myxococcota bacterium]|nr:hypothetical protein [Myxococcota bacterium]
MGIDQYTFQGYEVIAEVVTGDPHYPKAVLCKATKSTALNAETEPWVVWPMREDGTRGNGSYRSTFEQAWRALAGWAKR